MNTTPIMKMYKNSILIALGFLLFPFLGQGQAYSPIMLEPLAINAQVYRPNTQKLQPIRPTVSPSSFGLTTAPSQFSPITNIEGVPSHYPHLDVNEQHLINIQNTPYANSYGTVAPDVFEKVKHKIYNPEVNSWGVSELLSVGTTDFSGSSPERIFNIMHSLFRLDGLIIRPGEEYSFLKNMGEISERTGYKNSKVIYEGVSTDGVGGGVCQTSTTIYRAALMAGLPITAHKAHSFNLPYYGELAGLDATIWNPTVDLKWRNDTSAPILIRTFVRANKVMILFYGKKDRDTVMLMDYNNSSFKQGGKVGWTREIYKNGGIYATEKITHEYKEFEKDD